MSDENHSELRPGARTGTDLTGLTGKDLILAITKMNVGQKQLLAVRGNAAVRKILLRDPNVEVQLAIVNGPKTSESEIEQLASLPASAEVVLKTIFSSSRWVRSYRIRHALARNPKTPASIATRCMRQLTPHDLRKLAADPNIRKPIAQAAQRLLQNHK